MSRTLDLKGDWICLPCGKRIPKDQFDQAVQRIIEDLFGVR